jgi:hypothetical protein
MMRYGQVTLQGAPTLFANSFPKSGTHLLTQILSAFTKIGPAVNSGLPAVVTFDGWTGAPRPINVIIKDLQRYEAGDIGYGHLHALPEVAELLCGKGWATYFILRDPRDIVVSHVFYVTELEPAHVHHAHYTQVLRTFSDRLTTSIQGLHQSSIPFPDIAGRIRPYLPWTSQPEVLTLHYEDLIHQPDKALLHILNHALERGFPLGMSEDQALSKLKEAIKPNQSPTFRQGKTGGWVEHFSPEHIRLFKKLAGDLLIELNYERNYDW